MRFALALLVLLAPAAWAQDWRAVGRLEIGDQPFCTGALVARDLVLTAAHCLFHKDSDARLDPASIRFRAGGLVREVQQAVASHGFVPSGNPKPSRLQNDIALLELAAPMPMTPFPTGDQPEVGAKVSMASEPCNVLARQDGVLVTSCHVDFGSSGSPIFHVENGVTRIVSVVSAKAEVDGAPVSLGTSLGGPLDRLRAELRAEQFGGTQALVSRRIQAGDARPDIEAKFLRP